MLYCAQSLLPLPTKLEPKLKNLGTNLDEIWCVAWEWPKDEGTVICSQIRNQDPVQLSTLDITQKLIYIFLWSFVGLKYELSELPNTHFTIVITRQNLNSANIDQFCLSILFLGQLLAGGRVLTHWVCCFIVYSYMALDQLHWHNRADWHSLPCWETMSSDLCVYQAWNVEHSFPDL